MTTGVVQEEMLVPISPQRPNAVKTAYDALSIKHVLCLDCCDVQFSNSPSPRSRGLAAPFRSGRLAGVMMATMMITHASNEYVFCRKEDAEAVMKLLNTRQRRRDKNKKRERDSQAKKDERLLRLKQAQEDLDVVMKEAPLIVDSSAFRADMDEVEPESEFNCFECQVCT